MESNSTEFQYLMNGSMLLNHVSLTLEQYFTLLTILFKITCILSFLYSLFKIANRLNYPHFKRTLLLWAITTSSIIVRQLAILIMTFNDSNFQNIADFFLLSTCASLVLNVILHPDGFLLSHVQIVRVHSLFRGIECETKRPYLTRKAIEYVEFLQTIETN
jgi:hypothetical protein